MVDSNRVKVSFQKIAIYNTQLRDQGVYQCFLQYGKHQVYGSSQLLFPGKHAVLIDNLIN